MTIMIVIGLASVNFSSIQQRTAGNFRTQQQAFVCRRKYSVGGREMFKRGKPLFRHYVVRQQLSQRALLSWDEQRQYGALSFRVVITLDTRCHMEQLEPTPECLASCGRCNRALYHRIPVLCADKILLVHPQTQPGLRNGQALPNNGTVSIGC